MSRNEYKRPFTYLAYSSEQGSVNISFQDVLNSADTFVNNVIDVNIWYIAFVFLIGFGIFFTIKLKGMQLRHVGEAGHLAFTGEKKSSVGKSISSFEAFCIGLGARIGIGNIAGVAAAIVTGGPGAIFWMWIFAVIGAASSFMECTLGQIFKEKKETHGLYVGGPAYYIKNGLKKHRYALFVAVLTVITYGIGFVGVQAGSASDAFIAAFDFSNNTLIFAIVLTVITAFIIFGGIKRIARASYYMVPAMALCWLVLCLIVIAINYGMIPSAIEAIFVDAFTPQSLVGGGIGTVILTGLRRGVFSNEAGIGSVPNVASAAEVKHPVKQGLIQSLGVLIDTLLVCSATAFVILTFGDYSYILGTGLTKAPLVQYIMSESFLGSIAPPLLAIFMVVFAFSSLIGYYSISESNVKFLTHNKRYTLVLQCIIVAIVFISCIIPLNLMWDICDVFMACMGIANMTAVLLLCRYAFAAYKDYRAQKKAGIEEPEFSKECLGDLDTSGVTVWDKGKAEEYKD